MKLFKHFFLESGLASGKTLTDLAQKHKVNISVLKTQLAKGLKVEREHTQSKNKARKIAMDHLFEDPHYYTKLKKL